MIPVPIGRKKKVEAWFKTDPLPAFRDRLQDDSRFDENALVDLERATELTIAQSVEFALASEEPSLASALEHVYAD